MAKIRKSTEKFMLSHTLIDGESTKFVRAKIFNTSGVNVTPAPGYVNLTHIENGTFMNSTADLFMPDGLYLVQYAVYNSNTYTVFDEKYGIVEEDFWVSDFETRISNKIPNNILLDNDARLSNLNTIPNLSTTSQLTTAKNDIITQVNLNTDNSDGRAV